MNVKKDKRSETNKPRFCLQKGTLGDCIYITLHDYACVQLWLWHDSWSSKWPLPSLYTLFDPMQASKLLGQRLVCNIYWPPRWVVILCLFSSLSVDFISFCFWGHLFKNLWWRRSFITFWAFPTQQMFPSSVCRLQICGPTNLNPFLSQTSTTPPLLPLLLPSSHSPLSRLLKSLKSLKSLSENRWWMLEWILALQAL